MSSGMKLTPPDRRVQRRAAPDAILQQHFAFHSAFFSFAFIFHPYSDSGCISAITERA